MGGLWVFLKKLGEHSSFYAKIIFLIFSAGIFKQGIGFQSKVQDFADFGIFIQSKKSIPTEIRVASLRPCVHWD
jgi:hypothetical protein